MAGARPKADADDGELPANSWFGQATNNASQMRVLCFLPKD
jgi:hypothetical protein